jgi:deoxyribodipyrimidine photolyase
MTSLFIFTRDLRLEDNTGLIQALKNSEKVLPIFIFDANQITDNNSYKSNNCVQFMIECLDELNDSLEEKGSRLFYFYSTDYESTIRKIIRNSDKYEINSIYITKDYTPFSKKREHILQKICKDEKDALRFSLERRKNDPSGTNTVFTGKSYYSVWKWDANYCANQNRQLTFECSLSVRKPFCKSLGYCLGEHLQYNGHFDHPRASCFN